MFSSVLKSDWYKPTEHPVESNTDVLGVTAEGRKFIVFYFSVTGCWEDSYCMIKRYIVKWTWLPPTNYRFDPTSYEVVPTS